MGTHRLRRTGRLAVLTLAVLSATGAVLARYPLDGYERTGIRRLRAYAMMQDGRMPGNIRLRPGAMLQQGAIQLRLRGVDEAFDVTRNMPIDPSLQAGIERILATRDPSYRLAILDITDPASPRYAAVRPDQGFIPGSVGKLLVMTALFNELARLYPDDVPARERLLRDTRVVADQFVVPNSHSVPIVADDWSRVTHRAIRVGDDFTLWEWVDHMVSPSSNAAGSMVWKEVMLMRQFGHRYPPPQAEADEFLRTTPKQELTERSIAVIEEPLLDLGLDTADLRIRTFFTATGSRIIPGKSSYATPRALVRWLVKLEKGEIVDEWSSLEMKRLLYFTRGRYRYAASPALNGAAVFFKSGSLYQCRPEEGYACGQYMGNAQNLMHSVAIVESPAGAERPRVYLVSMMSNVLKVNSAAEHMEVGTQIERLISSLHADTGF